MLAPILVGLALRGAHTLYETEKAANLSEKALLKREKAVEKEVDSYRNLDRAEESAEKSMKKLFNLKKGIYTTSMSDFKKTFEPISTLSFLKSVNNLTTGSELRVSSGLTEIDTMTTFYSEPMTQQQQLISLLFGGLGVMRAERKMQEQELAYASQQMRMAKLLETHANNKISVLETIKQKNDMLWDLIRKLNMIFITSLKTSKNSISIHGTKEMDYSDNEIDNLRFTLQLSDVICKLCESPLITSEGEFIQDSASLIKKGNEIILEANNKIQTRRG